MTKAKKDATVNGLAPAAGHLRVSDPKQAARDKTSLEAQRAQILLRAAREGYEVIKWYTEPGRSGDADRRPVFDELIRDAQRGAFKAIFAFDKDRVSRQDSQRYSARVVEPLRNAGVRICTVTGGGVDWDTLGGRLSDAALQEAKHDLLKGLARNVSRTLQAKAQQGKWIGAAPFGYFVVTPANCLALGVAYDPDEDGKLAVHPVYGPLMRSFFERYARYEISARHIAWELNFLHKVPAPRSAAWQVSTVLGMLRGKTYIGDGTWGKTNRSKYTVRTGGMVEDRPRDSRKREPTDEADWVERKVPALVGRAVWDRVQKRLAQSNPRRSAARKAEEGESYLTTPGLSPKDGGEGRRFIFTSIAWCGMCGGRLAAHAGGSGRSAFYKCGDAHTKKGTCREYRVTEPELVRNVAGVVCGILDDTPRDEWATLVRSRLEERSRIDPVELVRLKGERDELDRKITKGEENALLAEDPDEVRPLLARLHAWRKQRDTLATRVRELEALAVAPADVEAVVEAVVARMGDYYEALTSADFDEQYRVIRAVVERVDVAWESLTVGTRAVNRVESFRVRLREDAFLVRALVTEASVNVSSPGCGTPTPRTAAAGWSCCS
jgi:DNA invertase Pin-like site-specific DNA recombinase